jgi:hypothetical protein
MNLEEINKNLKTTPVKGKDYVEVNERVKAFRKLYPEGIIDTKIESIENGVCIIKAQVGFYEEDGCVRWLASGIAYEKEGSTFINKTSYIENCETSAVGRALGFMGIGIDTGIASKEEVENAIENQPKQINSTKASAIKELIKRKGANLEEILKYYKIATIDQLDEQQYVQLYENLDKREDIA